MKNCVGIQTLNPCVNSNPESQYRHIMFAINITIIYGFRFMQ